MKTFSDHLQEALDTTIKYKDMPGYELNLMVYFIKSNKEITFCPAGSLLIEKFSKKTWVLNYEVYCEKEEIDIIQNISRYILNSTNLYSYNFSSKKLSADLTNKISSRRIGSLKDIHDNEGFEEFRKVFQEEINILKGFKI